MRFLYADASGSPNSDPNRNSLVVRLDLGSHRILLMGDAGAGARAPPSTPPALQSTEARLLACCGQALAAEILVVGHHGSETSSRARFLDAVGASSFIVSSGPNAYNGRVLPDLDVMQELLRRGQVFRTNIDDDACAANAHKIGPDNDNRPGGCDAIVVAIDAHSAHVSYLHAAD